MATSQQRQSGASKLLACAGAATLSVSKKLALGAKKEPT